MVMGIDRVRTPFDRALIPRWRDTATNSRSVLASKAAELTAHGVFTSPPGFLLWEFSQDVNKWATGYPWPWG